MLYGEEEGESQFPGGFRFTTDTQQVVNNVEAGRTAFDHLLGPRTDDKPVIEEGNYTCCRKDRLSL